MNFQVLNILLLGFLLRKEKECIRLPKLVRPTAPFFKKHIVKTMLCGHVLGKQFTGE